MKNKLLSNLSYLLCAGLGLLHFILLAIPYGSAFVSYSVGGSYAEGFSGYKVMNTWDFGFPGVMCSFIQIIILIGAIAMLAYGVLGLLKAFDIVSVLPDEIGGFSVKKCGDYALFGYAGLNFLLFVFMAILSIANTEAEEIGGGTMKAGIGLGAGLFITLIIAAGGAVAVYFVPKKFPVDDNAPVVSYVCPQCGKKTKKSVNFCPDCGAEIEEKIEIPAVYLCEECGKKVKKGINFCSDCGGRIVEVVATPKEEE